MNGTLETTPPSAERAERLFLAAHRSAVQAHHTPLSLDVARLHALFTDERADRASGYLRDAAMRRAYLGYFAPLNAVKVAQLLQQLTTEGVLPRCEHPKILDLGAGPLSALAGAWIHYGALGACVAVDLAQRAMEDGRRMLDDAGATPTIDSLELRCRSVTGVFGSPDERADVVIMANVLNEVGDPRRDLERRVQIVERALSCTRPGGVVLVMDPGTRVHGRGLQQLRDALLDKRSADVIAPCSGAQRCPLLVRSSDWCHQELPWRPPPEIARLERAAGLQKQTLKFSFLLLRAPDPSSRTLGSAGLRLVGGLMRSSDAERRYACSAEGLVTLQSRAKRLPWRVAGAHRGAWLSSSPPEVDVLFESPSRQPGLEGGAKPSSPRNRSRRRRFGASGGAGVKGPSADRS